MQISKSGTAWYQAAWYQAAAWSIRHMPDQIRRQPDQSGCCLIKIRQLPDRSGTCQIKIRQQPDRSGCCLIKIRQLPDWSGPWFVRSLHYTPEDARTKTRLLLKTLGSCFVFRIFLMELAAWLSVTLNVGFYPCSSSWVNTCSNAAMMCSSDWLAIGMAKM